MRHQKIWTCFRGLKSGNQISINNLPQFWRDDVFRSSRHGPELWSVRGQMSHYTSSKVGNLRLWIKVIRSDLCVLWSENVSYSVWNLNALRVEQLSQTINERVHQEGRTEPLDLIGQVIRKLSPYDDVWDRTSAMLLRSPSILVSIAGSPGNVLRTSKNNSMPSSSRNT